MNIVIVGVGGIGSWFVDFLSKWLYNSPYLEAEKVVINMIDGDKIEMKNKTRQSFKQFDDGFKVNIKVEELINNYGDRIEYQTHPLFIAETSSNKTIAISETIHDGDHVFLCVDNHKTRKQILEYVQELKNIFLVNMTNDEFDGSVQYYFKMNGKQMTENILNYHPEIKEAKDKSPDEMSCEELYNSGGVQIIFANINAALIGCEYYRMFLSGKLKKYLSEAYFDINEIKTVLAERKMKSK